MSARAGSVGGTAGDERSAVDMLVVAIVNAPYRRDITADILAKRLATADLGEWIVHITSFFTEVSPELVLAFADFHHVSVSKLAETYAVMKSATGEANSELESALASLAPTA